LSRQFSSTPACSSGFATPEDSNNNIKQNHSVAVKMSAADANKVGAKETAPKDPDGMDGESEM
jgi:hypothetical protein